MSNIKATIITIGDELLIGQTIDTNSAWIAQQLNKLGIDVLRRVAVGDIKSEMRRALDEELETASIVLITGGLGPTSDDITKPFLLEYFGGNMVVEDRVLEHIKGIFSRRNRPFLERNMKQAEVPDSCTVLFNRMGTAPGMWFEKDGKVIISMPGVPFEMMAIMEDEVLSRLESKFPIDALVHRNIITAGEGESFIAERIMDIEASLPSHIRLAYLPSYGMVKLRLTGRGADKEVLTKEVEDFQAQLADCLSNIVIALEDLPLEAILGRSLTEKGLTVGMAESCTGGYMGHLITQVNGSSNYFQGSLVCYQNHIKEEVLGVKHETIAEHGAVSEQTSIEMALGAQRILNSDFAFSVTGLLSQGDESYKVPIGTVWMAVATKNADVRTRKFQFHYDRIRNKEMAVHMGLFFIWQCVNDKV